MQLHKDFDSASIRVPLALLPSHHGTNPEIPMILRVSDKDDDDDFDWWKDG